MGRRQQRPDGDRVAMAFHVNKPMPLLASLMTSIFAVHMLRLLAARPSLKSVEGLEDDIGVHVRDGWGMVLCM